MIYAVGRTYLLRPTQATRMLMFMPVIMLGGGILVGIVLVTIHGFVLPGAAIFPIWLAIMTFVASRYLGFPHTIEWSSEGTITFRSHLRKTTLSPREIISIKPTQGMLGILELRFGKRKLLFPSQFDDFHEFIARLKAENPSVELRGC